MITDSESSSKHASFMLSRFLSESKPSGKKVQINVMLQKQMKAIISNQSAKKQISRQKTNQSAERNITNQSAHSNPIRTGDSANTSYFLNIYPGWGQAEMNSTRDCFYQRKLLHVKLNQQSSQLPHLLHQYSRYTQAFHGRRV